MNMRIAAAICLVLTAACADSAPRSGAPGRTEEQASSRAALERAHQGFLTGDALGMTRALREVLSDGAADPSVRDNALALLEKAHEVKGGSLPADWVLPAGMTKLMLNQMRTEESNQTRWSIYLSGFVDDPAHLVGLRLSQGDDTLLDMAAAGVKSKVERRDDGQYYFSHEVRMLRPIAAGAYTIEIQMRSAPAVSGWILVGDLASTGAPRIEEPGMDAVVSDAPELRFEDYTTPAYRPFEWRSLSIWLTNEADGRSWSLWTGRPDFTAVTLGTDPRGAPQGKLTPGHHWLLLSFEENSRFGPVELHRVSRRLHSFFVK